MIYRLICWLRGHDLGEPKLTSYSANGWWEYKPCFRCCRWITVKRDDIKWPDGGWSIKRRHR